MPDPGYYLNPQNWNWQDSAGIPTPPAAGPFPAANSVDWLQQRLPRPIGDWFGNAYEQGQQWGNEVSDPRKLAGEAISGAMSVMPMGGIGRVSPKTMRLYRGETNLPQAQALPEWLMADPNVQATVDATGRWFTPDLEVAKYYNRTFGDKSGRVSFVDMPAADAEKYLSANQPEASKFSAFGRDREEYFLPRDIANARKPYRDGR